MAKDKYFICSDIHGFFTEWMAALKEAGFDIGNKNHKLVICGDLLDRGSEAIKCLRFVCALLDENRVICIKGNHELLFEEIYRKKCFEKHDVSNGTYGTYKQLAYGDIEYDENWEDSKGNRDIIERGYSNPLMQKYLNSCRNYYETSKYIFVHSYIPVHIGNDKTDVWALDLENPFGFEYYEDWRNASEVEWEEAMWCNPFKIWRQGVLEPNKTLVCGHWGTYEPNWQFHHKGQLDQNVFIVKGEYEYCFDIFKEDGIIGLDATTAYSHKVNVLVVSNGMKEVKNENSSN